MQQLTKQIEALLFSAGRKMGVDELAKLTKSKIDRVKDSLVELKTAYDDHDLSVQLMNEGDFWKIQVREQFLPLVRSIVSETELSKTIMETLAVIAFKYPIKQSDLIKIRTNKAYDHLRDLENMGYITRQKHGRSNLIKLTQKFFEYFDLREEQLKEKFSDFRSIAAAIEGKEREIETMRELQQEEARKEQSLDQKEAAIESQIAALEPYGSDHGTDEVLEDTQTLGDLEVVDELPLEEIAKEHTRIKELQEADQKQREERVRKEKELAAAMNQNPELDHIVDEKVDKILHPSEEQETEESSSSPSQPEPENPAAEPADLLEAAMEADQKRKKKDKGT